MNLILVKQEDFTAPDRVRLTGRRLAHIRKVHRAQTGDSLLTGRLNGPMGQGVVTHISREAVEMELSLTKEPPPPLPLTLVLALPRPKMLKRILQCVTSLGVKKIHLINSWRVEKGFWSSPILEPLRLEREMILGLEQACDTRLPKVHLERFFSPFVKETLPAITRDTLNLAAHPKTHAPCPKNPGRPVTLVMGPEGGFIDIEVTTLEEAGFAPVSLGPRILRTETAVPVLISRLF